MSDITYSFTNQNDSKDLVFQSKVNAFNQDHITSKDLKSFYINFSKSTYFDTGLLPVDGSGLLSIRTAGPHTQIGYQHKPGMYYINWGGYEGDPNAAKIYVAQPYRIVIADIYNNNILGARTFYSPIPITYPEAPLYHVNLPNINCKGYRGNGVGWICLYHTEDISSYPFNEKVAKIIERCSGVEAYNDANMSETDGPRFYAQHGKPIHITNPSKWEEYSAKNDISWTLDPDLWIPVLVKDIDHQDQHDPDGIPLTYAGALLGDYQAYYTDPIRPKPVNKIVREDLNIESSEIFNWFKQSFNTSVEFGDLLKVNDSFTSATEVREKLSTIFVAPPSSNEDEDEDEDGNYEICYECEDSINLNSHEYMTDYFGRYFCQPCAENSLVYVEHVDGYFGQSANVHFLESAEQWIYAPKWNEKTQCGNCSRTHVFSSSYKIFENHLDIYHIKQDEMFEGYPSTCCNFCIETITAEVTTCHKCSTKVPNKNNVYISNNVLIDTPELGLTEHHLCNECYLTETSIHERNMSLTLQDEMYCICGNSSNVESFTNTYKILFNGLKTNHFFIASSIPTESALDSYLRKNRFLISNIQAFIPGFDHHLNNKDEINSIDISDYGLNVYVDRLCPTCMMEYSPDSSPSLIQENIIQKLEEFISNDIPLNKVYGIKIQIASWF